MKQPLPKPIDSGRHKAFTIGNLHHEFLRHLDNIAQGLPSDFDKADRNVCGYPVPEFQRSLEWTQEQQESFIRAVWLELPLGEYVVHAQDWVGDEARPLSGIVLDGQQRLYALERFFKDEIGLFDYTFSEMPQPDRRRFLRVNFSCREVALWDKAQVVDLYERIALGGVPHNREETLEKIASYKANLSP